MLPNFQDEIELLRQKTLTQLKSTLLAGMSKRDLLILANGSDRIVDDPIRSYREDGQIEFQTETARDVETGEVVYSKVITWSYYETGEVDEITILEQGNKKVIKHFLDGRQPEVTE